jgi:hypothetical protein
MVSTAAAIDPALKLPRRILPAFYSVLLHFKLPLLRLRIRHHIRLHFQVVQQVKVGIQVVVLFQ